MSHYRNPDGSDPFKNYDNWKLASPYDDIEEEMDVEDVIDDEDNTNDEEGIEE